MLQTLLHYGVHYVACHPTIHNTMTRVSVTETHHDT